MCITHVIGSFGGVQTGTSSVSGACASRVEIGARSEISDAFFAKRSFAAMLVYMLVSKAQWDAKEVEYYGAPLGAPHRLYGRWAS
jgi:hypothetical protein